MAGLISQQQQAAATDPLVNIADLSDGSPFADSEVDPGQNQNLDEYTASSDAFGRPVRHQSWSEPVDELAASEVASNESPTPGIE